MKYYTIYDDDDNFKIGLNTRKINLNSLFDFNKSGISFYDAKNVFAFIHSGIFLSEIKIIKNSKIYDLGDRYLTNKLIIKKKEKITIETIKNLLKNKADPKVNKSFALRWAVDNNLIDIAKLLLPVSAPLACTSEALYIAVKKNYKEIAKLLLPVSGLTLLIDLLKSSPCLDNFYTFEKNFKKIFGENI